MHAPAAFQLTVTRFSLWRSALAILALLLAMVAVLWCTQFAPFNVWRVVLAVAAVSAVCAALWPLAMIQPFSLRWDGQSWHAGPAASRGQEPCAGRVDVAVDLGVFLLLRFVPQGKAPLWRHRWLPVQRAGHAPVWHVLRCTVFAYQPAPDPTALDTQLL